MPPWRPRALGGMGDASLLPQGAAPAPPLQGGMGDASLVPMGAASAPPLQGGVGDASSLSPGNLPAPCYILEEIEWIGIVEVGRPLVRGWSG
jgi:hypothetical protein